MRVHASACVDPYDKRLERVYCREMMMMTHWHARRTHNDPRSCSLTPPPHTHTHTPPHRHGPHQSASRVGHHHSSKARSCHSADHTQHGGGGCTGGQDCNHGTGVHSCTGQQHSPQAEVWLRLPGEGCCVSQP
jgi:hypothetical protein